LDIIINGAIPRIDNRYAVREHEVELAHSRRVTTAEARFEPIGHALNRPFDQLRAVVCSRLAACSISPISRPISQ
jgi:hypothetical protein